MRARKLSYPAAVLAAATCLAPAASPAQQLDNPRCPALFSLYDTATQVFGRTSNRRDETAPPAVMDAARLLRMNNCLTFSDALAGMAAFPPKAGIAARTASGASIAPIYLHAGIVTSTADDEKARSFFESQGLRARSVGAAFLGRRIYVGPFDTVGALEGARTMAVLAGFAYPYPARF